jgi:hypothetical protein
MRQNRQSRSSGASSELHLVVRLGVPAVLVLAALAFAPRGHGQYPVMAFGNGYARSCYDVVKGEIAPPP